MITPQHLTAGNARSPAGTTLLDGCPGERRAIWYWLGAAHIRLVRAHDEDATRAAVLARHSHARGQRLTLEPYHS